MRRGVRAEGLILAAALTSAWLLALAVGAVPAALAHLLGIGDSMLVLLVSVLFSGMGLSVVAYRMAMRLMRRPRKDGAAVRLYETELVVANVRVPIDEHLETDVRWFIGYAGTGRDRGLLSAAHLRVRSPGADFTLYTSGELGALVQQAEALGAQRTRDFFSGVDIPRWQIWPDDWLELAAALQRQRRALER